MAQRLSDSAKKKLSAAIAAAEKGHRCEIRIHLEGSCEGSALDRARTLFGTLCSEKTQGDTAVLLYVAEVSKVAAVWAGKGVHGGDEQTLWQDVKHLDVTASPWLKWQVVDKPGAK